MKMKARLIVAVGFLCSLIFVGLMLAPLAGQLNGYNPWLDSNDDGVIDVLDLQALGAAYGSSGTPLNKMALAYDSGWLDISEMQGQNITVTHNLNLAPETDFVQTAYGKTLPESEVHQKYFGGTGYAPGWNASYVSDLPGPLGRPRGCIRSVVQTSDGGYAMAGYAYNATNEKYLFWLVKTDPAGNHQWNKTYAITGMDRAYAYSVVQTSDDGYALAGCFVSGLTANLPIPLLVKTNSTGDMEWYMAYPYHLPESSEAYSVVQTSDDGYALAGYTNTTDSGAMTFWLVITDSYGVPEYRKTYGETPSYAHSLIKTADGYAMAGWVDNPPNGWDAWLVKVDASGNHQWNKTYAFHTPKYTDDYAYSLVQTADEGYALAGWTETDPGFGIWLVKTDASGTHQWNKTYSSGPNYDCAFSLVQTGDGGYAMAGYANSTQSPEYTYSMSVPASYYSDYWLIKTDSAGNVQWDRTFGDKGQNAIEVAFSMLMTADGGFAIAGFDWRPGAGIFGWLVKTDAFGLCDRADCEFGLAVVEITANTLILYRGKIDPYWNYLRVRIWVAKQNP